MIYDLSWPSWEVWAYLVYFGCIVIVIIAFAIEIGKNK